MNRDFLNTTISQEVLEQNLIDALTRLQNTAFDAEFLDAKNKLIDELPPEPFLGFCIGAYSFIVSAKCFCAIFVDTPVAPVPNAPDCLVGLSNIRGTLVPVYQLHSSLDSEIPKKYTIFCIGKGDSVIGILIDELPVSFSLSAHQRRASIDCNEAVLQPLIQASYLSNQTIWYLVDGNLFAGQLQAIANHANQSRKSSARAKSSYELAHS